MTLQSWCIFFGTPGMYHVPKLKKVADKMRAYVKVVVGELIHFNAKMSNFGFSSENKRYFGSEGRWYIVSGYILVESYRNVGEKSQDAPC